MRCRHAGLLPFLVNFVFVTIAHAAGPAAAGAALACPVASGATCRATASALVFTDRAAFVAALASGYDENAFDDVGAGTHGGLNYTRNRVEYLVYTPFGASGALYAGRGFVSAERVSDAIIVYFSGNPITAVGGNFWPSDFFLRPVDGSLDLVLSDGTRESIKSGGAESFRGFITSTPISNLVIDAPDVAPAPPGESPDRWPTFDNLIVGSGA